MDYSKWYIEKRPEIEKFVFKLEDLIIDVLNQNKIEYHRVGGRAKTVESFNKKIKVKSYDDPINDITDLVGIRIITYVEDTIPQVCKLLATLFDIDEENSIDKGEALGVDRVGYKSVHYIATLTKERDNLEEYQKFKEQKFEIQIRTILQHSWAEIEHDRNYKFSGELPKRIQRRFKLLAGLLELADNEFNNISKEIDEYSNEVKVSIEKGELQIQLNSASISEFLQERLPELFKLGMSTNFPYSSQTVKELNDFGIDNLNDLNEIIPKEFEEKHIQIMTGEYKSNIRGTLRHLMLINDYKKYFQKSFRYDFNHFIPNTSELLESFNIDMEKLKIEMNNALKKKRNTPYATES